jgi:hypothetical protein
MRRAKPLAPHLLSALVVFDINFRKTRCGTVVAESKAVLARSAQEELGKEK